ncbi:MAG: PAS domain-containing protein, partial [Mycobacteriales bacterium]
MDRSNDSARAHALLSLALVDKPVQDLLDEAVALVGLLVPGVSASYVPGDEGQDGIPVRRDDGHLHGVLRLSAVPTEADRAFLLRLAEVLGVALTREARMQELQHSERRMVEAQRISGVGSYDFEIASNTNTWSDQLYRIYGREPQSFMASYEVFVSMLHPDDREHVMAVHQRSLETLQPFEMEERIVWPDGQVRTLASWGEVVSDAEGKPARMVGICWDITEQRLMEERLRHGALHDALTGLPNRALIEDRLALAVPALARHELPLGLLFIDIDRFTMVNDSLGHDVGDV